MNRTSYYPSAKWQEMKSLNARLVAYNKASKRASTEAAMVVNKMTMDDAPKVGRRYLSQSEAVRRYERREEMSAPMYGRNIFRAGQTMRPEKGKQKNGYSREEAGTIGTMVVGIRTGKNSVCVCKTRKYS